MYVIINNVINDTFLMVLINTITDGIDKFITNLIINIDA